MQHATCNMQYATCNIQYDTTHNTHNIQHTTHINLPGQKGRKNTSSRVRILSSTSGRSSVGWQLEKKLEKKCSVGIGYLVSIHVFIYFYTIHVYNGRCCCCSGRISSLLQPCPCAFCALEMPNGCCAYIHVPR